MGTYIKTLFLIFTSLKKIFPRPTWIWGKIIKEMVPAYLPAPKLPGCIGQTDDFFGLIIHDGNWRLYGGNMGM